MKARRGVRCVCVLGHGGSQGGSARIPLLTPALPCPLSVCLFQSSSCTDLQIHVQWKVMPLEHFCGFSASLK